MAGIESDTDSLAFESADEVDLNDADVADLDLSDIENDKDFEFLKEDSTQASATTSATTIAASVTAPSPTPPPPPPQVPIAEVDNESIERDAIASDSISVVSQEKQANAPSSSQDEPVHESESAPVSSSVVEEKQAEAEEAAPSETANATDTAAALSGWNVDDELDVSIDDETSKDESTKSKPVDEEKKVEETPPSPPPQQPQPQPQPEQAAKKPASASGGGWSWSRLGADLFSTAANITTHLNEGLNIVLETVETTIGAPNPAELAAKDAEKEQADATQTTASKEEPAASNEQASANKEAKSSSDWISGDDQEWFTLNKIIASKGSSLVTGGLEVLETVGKKTFEVISDKDPNLKQTREFLSKVPATLVPAASSAKPNLSQLLREAEQEQTRKQEEAKSSQAQRNVAALVDKPTFAAYFDEFQGDAHFEALDMLSRQESLKVEHSGAALSKETREAIATLEPLFDKDKLSGEDDEDEAALLTSFDSERFKQELHDLAHKMSVRLLVLDRVVAAFDSSLQSCRDARTCDELQNEAIKCFALIASNLTEMYHKAGETFIVDKSFVDVKAKQASLKETAGILNAITRHCIRSITALADEFSKKCKSLSRDPKISSQIATDIYLEASNSCTYVGDAYSFFLPIFKSHLITLRQQQQEQADE